MNSTNLQNHPTFHLKERLFNLHSTQKRALCWSIFSHMNIKILLRFIVIATGLNAVYSVPKKVLGIRFRADPESSCRLLTKAELKKSGYDPDLQKPFTVQYSNMFFSHRKRYNFLYENVPYNYCPILHALYKVNMFWALNNFLSCGLGV